MKRLRLSDITYTPASGADRRAGIVGWFSLIDDRKWRINGVCLRRRADGNHVITFPSRRSTSGTEYRYVAPFDADLHREVEEAIHAYLQQQAQRPTRKRGAP